jgi:hypothetical protein
MVLGCSFKTINHPQKPIHESVIKPKYEVNLTTDQIQDKANKINGIATECMMDDFYLNSGDELKWQKIEGMSDGRHGIDGLYVKAVNGIVKDVLVAESKWNHSRLSFTKNKTVKQMSRQWILDKLKEVEIDKSQMALYEQITRYVDKGIYRGVLFNLKPSGDNLKVYLYTIKSKDDINNFEKTKDRVISIDLKHPQNKFYSSLVDSFNRCRVMAIKEKLPMLDDSDIKELLSDGYIEGKDIEKVLNKTVKTAKSSDNQ